MLKELREEHGYTQEEMAILLGYSSRSGYCMLENGKVKLTLSKIKKLAEIFNVDIKYFFK